MTETSIKTVADLVAAGRPGAGFALTHDISVVTMDKTLRRLPYGVVHQATPESPAEVVRDYAWRRYSGSVQLAVGAVRGDHEMPVEVYPRILAATLERLGDIDATRHPDTVLKLLKRLPYSDLIVMLIDRAWHIDGRIPVHPAYVCEGCEQPLSTTLKAEPSHMSVGTVEWSPDAPPSGVVWLDDPFEYGQEKVTALIVTAITWQNLYRDQPASVLQNRKWGTIRTASESIAGYVIEEDGKPVVRHVPIGRRDVEELMCGRADWDRTASAVYGCSGGAMLVGRVKHRCGEETAVPFDWLAATVI